MHCSVMLFRFTLPSANNQIADWEFCIPDFQPLTSQLFRLKSYILTVLRQINVGFFIHTQSALAGPG